LIDKIEKLGTNPNEEKQEQENEEPIDGSGIKLNYDGTLLHI
jgi:hypothetical protein